MARCIPWQDLSQEYSKIMARSCRDPTNKEYPWSVNPGLIGVIDVTVVMDGNYEDCVIECAFSNEYRASGSRIRDETTEIF